MSKDSYLNTSSLSVADRTVYERGVWQWSGVLRDQAGSAISAADMTTVTCSVRDAQTGQVLVNARDVKNANEGTLDVNGNQVVVLSGADNAFVAKGIDREVHQVTIDYTWNAGAKRHWHVIELHVVNHPGIA